MSKSEKTAYLEAIRERYRKANRQLKRLILNEFCEVCHYHRKHAIRLLSRKTSKVRHRSGRKALYRSDEFLKSLKRFWPLYREGRQSILEVLRAEAGLADAQAGYWGTLYEVHQGYAGLLLAAGALDAEGIAVLYRNLREVQP